MYIRQHSYLLVLSVVIFEWTICMTESFATHASIFIKTTKSETKPRFFSQKCTKPTVNENLETIATVSIMSP